MQVKQSNWNELLKASSLSKAAGGSKETQAEHILTCMTMAASSAMVLAFWTPCAITSDIVQVALEAVTPLRGRVSDNASFSFGHLLIISIAAAFFLGGRSSSSVCDVHVVGVRRAVGSPAENLSDTVTPGWSRPLLLFWKAWPINAAAPAATTN